MQHITFVNLAFHNKTILRSLEMRITFNARFVSDMFILKSAVPRIKFCESKMPTSGHDPIFVEHNCRYSLFCLYVVEKINIHRQGQNRKV